ncbi:MAG: [protein-PII] uridylyltransferase, partial [Pseudomonadota bacterium]
MDRTTHQGVPNQRAVIDRRDLVEALDGLVDQRLSESDLRAAVLALLKQALADGRAEIRRRFDADRDNRRKGRDASRAYGFLIDQIIRLLYDFAFERAYPIGNPTAGEKQSVVAVGGYGRGELAPHSDVDLLFLQHYKVTPHTEQVIEYILYMLWDLGLKVGHATRSVDDCIRMAKQDQTIRTALLEARYLWGDNALYQELRRRFRESAESDSGLDFIESKLAERDARHQKLGDSRYVLEPNIKEGKGGLRDLQTLYWIAKYLYGVDEVIDLVGKEVFTKREAVKFERALGLLMTIRCHMHYLSGREEDRLTFDLQPKVGERMNYTDHRGASGVERFMKHYYMLAKDVGDLTRILCAQLEVEHRRKPRLRLFGGRTRDIDGFIAEGERLNVPADDHFERHPVDLLRLFQVAQENKLDIHPAALRQVTQNLKHIDHDLQRDPEANRLFIEMLTGRNAPESTLRRLNEAGVFGRFVPDFGRVVAQMQHDMYHVFTVDEHTIRAIGLLHKIEQGALVDDHPLASEIIGKVSSRRALYTAVLLHDIAKGRGGDHSVLGAEVAERLCPRFGLDDEETETVAWLVRQHLLMSMTAQKRDIDDPKTITDFAAVMQSPERLRLLLILTVVDMRATGPHVWNGWKATLLRELYYRTEEVLAGQPAGGNVAARVAKAKELAGDALKQAGDWEASVTDDYLERGYPDYWLSLQDQDHVRTLTFMRRADEAGEKLAVDIHVDPDRSVTEVCIYTPDHAGLFSQIAGGMALAGASIVDAKIFTMSNGWALDIFSVQDSDGNAFGRNEQIDKLRMRMEGALTGTLWPTRELSGRESLPKRAHVFRVPPRVIVDNTASRHFTVVEIN